MPQIVQLHATVKPADPHVPQRLSQFRVPHQRRQVVEDDGHGDWTGPGGTGSSLVVEFVILHLGHGQVDQHAGEVEAEFGGSDAARDSRQIPVSPQ